MVSTGDSLLCHLMNIDDGVLSKPRVVHGLMAKSALGENNKNNITKNKTPPHSPDCVLGTALNAFHILTPLGS